MCQKGGICVDIQGYLEQIAKLDKLMNDKLAERDQIIALSARLNPNMDGMPHGGGGVSDPVGNGAVKLVMLGHEIDQLIDKYVDLKREMDKVLRSLPIMEYMVLHQYYVLGMTISEIAKYMGYSSRQIARIKKKALENVKLSSHVISNCDIIVS
jgi:hypothetical protein